MLVLLLNLAFVHVRGQRSAVIASHLLVGWAVLVHLHLHALHKEAGSMATGGLWPGLPLALLLSLLALLLTLLTLRCLGVILTTELVLERLVHGQASVHSSGKHGLHVGIQGLSEDSDSRCLIHSSVLEHRRLVHVALNDAGVSSTTTRTLFSSRILSLGFGFRVLGFAGSQRGFVDHGGQSSAALRRTLLE